MWFLASACCRVDRGLCVEEGKTAGASGPEFWTWTRPIQQ